MPELRLAVVARLALADVTLSRHDTGGHPGQLRRGCWDYFVTPGGKRTAAVACPSCDRLFSVADHEVDAGGTCHPSVVCPRSGCSFHEFVMLAGWTP